MNNLIVFLTDKKNKPLFQMYLKNYNLDEEQFINIICSYTDDKDFHLDIGYLKRGFNSEASSDPDVFNKLADLYHHYLYDLLPSVRQKLLNLYSDEDHKKSDIKYFLSMLNKKKINIQSYLTKQQGFSTCDATYFSDFYEALEKTDHSQLVKLLDKMIRDDIKEFRQEVIDHQRNARAGVVKKYNIVNDDEKVERMMGVLIKIFYDCRSYYSYFDLLKNLHCLKDSLKNKIRDKECQNITYRLVKYIPYTSKLFDPYSPIPSLNNKKSDWAKLRSFKWSTKIAIPYKNKNNEVLIAIDWFNDNQICDYAELLKMYFEYYKIRESKSLYDNLFPSGIFIIEKAYYKNYGRFTGTLLDYLSTTYTEHPYWDDYARDLKDLCETNGLKGEWCKIFGDQDPVECPKDK